MRILLIGGGGREHALGRKIMADAPETELHSAPGNPGLAALGACHEVGAGDVAGLVALATGLRPDLVLVGPEDPLTRGLVDALRTRSIPAFGPDQIGAQLEASKSFAKMVMAEAGVPTARFQRFEQATEAEAALDDWPERVVIKADGLAAGKGVVVCDSRAEARAALATLAPLGQPLLIEERLQGPELSLFALVKGETVVPLTTAQDHKRVGEGDTGPNTGGMGAYSPAAVPADWTLDGLIDLTVRPVARAMVARGTPFCGVLFVGLMLTPAGPRVLEYNVRFGDPECQVLMARLKSPLVPLIQTLQRGTTPQVAWHDRAAMTVVLAAAGYPGAYKTGHPIKLPARTPSQSHLIHAGTRLQDGHLKTAGGRVLNAVGQGPTLSAARAAAYALADQVQWPGKVYRRDIGWQALSNA